MKLHRAKLWVAQVGLAMLTLVVLVNGAVRLTGGSPALWSPLYLGPKVSALARLAGHLVLEPWSPCPKDPDALLVQAARRHQVPPELARAVGRAESGLHPHRVSAAGAMGLMQLMPGTARELGVEDPFHGGQSIDGGVRYLSRLLRRYDGDRARAVAAYNAGPGTVARHGALDLPRETRVYVRRVQALADARR